MNASCSTSAAFIENDPVTREIDASCRVPVLVLFFGAAFWLVVSSVFGLLASIKFHGPNFLADSAWLTYGRVYAASTNALLYGFAIPAGLGAGLWIIARLGRATVVQPFVIAFGAKLWNLGVLVGLVAILRGDSTGFESLEMPKAAAVILFIGYSLVAVWTLLTLHARQEKQMEAPQWFLLAALFWFPWIFSTAHLLLTVFPVRGVTQSIVNWWFIANLKLVWLGLVGLATVYYLLSQLMKRGLHSQYLALFTFWTIVLFASWSGIPNTAPVPAWMPALSTVATVLTLVTVLTVCVNVYRTCGHGCSEKSNPLPGKFVAFGVMAFVAAWVMNIAASLRELTPFLQFTWFTAAQSHLMVFGFFGMTLFGAIYYIVPRIMGFEWSCGNKVKASYWLAAGGVILYAAPLLVGGIIQGIKLNNPQVAFAAVSKASLMPLRVSSLGELLILAAGLLLFWNLSGVVFRWVWQQFKPVQGAVGLKAAEVKS